MCNLAILATLDGTLTYQNQQTSYYCVPASSRVTESAFGYLQSQQAWAAMEQTQSSGTPIGNIPGPLNTFESRNHYVDSTTTDSASDLWSRADLNVASYRAPLIPGIQGHDLPLWSQYGLWGSHAITLIGVYDDDVNIQYWDPLNDSRVNGRELTTDGNIYQGMLDFNGGNTELVW